MIDYERMPQTIKDFIFYLEVVVGKSKSTTYEYILDLANFFRFVKLRKTNMSKDTKLHDIPINDITVDMIAAVFILQGYLDSIYLKKKAEEEN